MADDRERGMPLVERVREAFSPAAPIAHRESFAGRAEHLAQIADVVAQRGQHALLYGERGVGKTSLAVVASGDLIDNRTLPLRVNCDGTDHFLSIWQKVLREVQLTRALPPAVGIRDLLDEATERAASLLGAGHLTVDVVRQALQVLSRAAPILLVLDEFDRLEDARTKMLFADTIKSLSDHLVLVTIIVVGVAENTGELLGEHRSIDRALMPIRVPRMSPAELAAIVRFGVRRADMTISNDAVERIADLAAGLPYYAHLLGLLAAREAMHSGRSVELAHVDRVALKAGESAQGR